MKKQLMIFLFLLIGSSLTFAQTKTIKGKVTSADDGFGMPGVSIIVDGTTVGVISDNNGNYSLSKVPADAVALRFQYLGMGTQTIAIEGKSVINVVLETEATGLNEVVVTALGVSREKKSLGYAVQSLNSDALVGSASPNVTGALQGKMAGVQISQSAQIGSSSRIVIRGNSSLGDNQPLLVVDGVPISRGSVEASGTDFGSGLNDINPEDIESVSVLKGGAAAGLYGMRAGHGVILITTKSGKSKKNGVTVSYNGNFNFDQVYSIQKFQDKYGQGYKGSEYYYKKAQADGYTGSYQEFATGGYDPGYGFKYVDGLGGGVRDGYDESWGPRLDAGLMITQFNSPVNNGVREATPWVSNPDNIKDYFELGHTTNHNVSIASNSDKSNVRFSLGYMDQKGVMPNTDLRRYSAAFNSSSTLSDKFDYNASLNFSRGESDNLPVGGYNGSNPMQGFGQWFGRQVDMKYLKDNWDVIGETGYPVNWNSNYSNNPYWSAYKNTNEYVKNRVFGKTSLNYSPIEMIKVEGRVGLDYYDMTTLNKTAYKSNETIDGDDWHGGEFYLRKRSRTEFNADVIAYFNKDLGSDFSLNGLVGANYRNMIYNYSLLGAEKLTIPDLYTISNVNGSPSTNQDHEHIRSNSVYLQASVGYKSFAFADFSYRTDWDSTIDSSLSYPGVSVSLLLSEALELPAAISYLKLRGGWAEVGSATSSYSNRPYYSTESTAFNGITQNYQSRTLPPAGLKPESVVTTEIGIESRFLNNRLGFEMSLYNKTTTDQIMDVDVSKSTGYDSMKLNAGELNNKGVEVSINGDIVRNADGFNWSATLNWSKDVSEIVDLYTDATSGQSLQSYEIGSEWSTQVLAIPGEAWGVIRGTGMARTDDGRVIIKNGMPVLESSQDLGSVSPDWLAGLSNEFSYKNWSAGFTLDMKKGGDVFSISNMFGAYAGQLEFTADGDFRENGRALSSSDLQDNQIAVVQNPDAEDSKDWTYGTENTDIVSAYDFFNSYYSNRELSVYDASYIKLREFHLAYVLPSSLLAQQGLIKSAKISLVGNNMAILYRHKSNIAKFDPENTTGSGNDGVGLESTSMPPSRSIGVKVSLKF